MKRPKAATAPEVFLRAIDALGPYREGVVLIGGFARDLYRHVPGFADPDVHAPGTNDVDLAVPDPLRLFGKIRLHDCLLQHGFKASERLGLDHRTVAKVYFPAEIDRPRPTDPHVDIITPLHGPERDTHAQPQPPDLFAFALRFVDLLLDDPITVDDPQVGTVRIPHPLAYIVQKTLIRPKRQTEGKQAKDQADAFFVVVSLQSAWSDWRARWKHITETPEQKQWLKTTAQRWDELYRSPDRPGAREVAAAYPRFPAEVVCRVMTDFQSALGVNVA
jgi:hypothetical protein